MNFPIAIGRRWLSEFGTVRAILCALVLVLFSPNTIAIEIVIFGDSWAEPMNPALVSVFSENGHSDVKVYSTLFWGLANRLQSPEGLKYITGVLSQHPDVDIVHLVTGYNDVHCKLVNSECLTKWLPSMDGTKEEEDILNEIVSDTEAIVDHILSIRPTVKIFLQSYDYMRPWGEINIMGTPSQNNSVHDKWAAKAQMLADRKPALTFLNLHGLLQVTYGFNGVTYTQYDPPSPIPAGHPSLPNPELPSPRQPFQRNDSSHLTWAGYKVMAKGQYDGFYGAVLDGEEFKINAGLNDAWYNPATNGQGFLITAFPDRKEMFLAWFTFDTERPPEDVGALLGEPGHRWLTAQGPYIGDTANLTIFVTEGGVFDAAEPATTTDPTGDGTMTLEFSDCANGLLNYEITSLGISGEIPIQRITPDNIALCETLGGQ